MYHVELRHFPFTAYRFNLGEPELLALLDPWVHDKWIDLDERKWNPQQARLNVLEGPEIPVYELSMGRGWRSAERKSKDVTTQVLERARALLLEGAGGDGTPAGGAAGGPLAGSGGVNEARAGGGDSSASLSDRALAPAVAASDAGHVGEPDLRSLLGDDPDALLQAWQLVIQRRPELPPSESLALAEQTLRSLG
ncbi:MAG TPA: hypothetical protein VMB51_06795 [Solirubrobacteraceae bacterium]|nr:hypothetical protein [Solirubrobacteraceae bacterium]